MNWALAVSSKSWCRYTPKRAVLPGEVGGWDCPGAVSTAAHHVSSVTAPRVLSEHPRGPQSRWHPKDHGSAEKNHKKQSGHHGVGWHSTWHSTLAHAIDVILAKSTCEASEVHSVRPVCNYSPHHHWYACGFTERLQPQSVRNLPDSCGP